MTASIGLAVVATTAAGYQASDGHQTGQAGFTVSAEAIEQANELANTQIENDAQLASARNQANASRAGPQEKGRRDQLVAAAAAAQARKQAAERAARAKEREALQKKREAVIARAQSDPKAAARVLLPDYGWGDEPVLLPRQPVGWARAGGTTRRRTPPRAPTASRSRCPRPRWPRSAPDWHDNPATQIKWGLQYIQSSYGSPCNAWAQWQSRSPHWY